MPNTKSAKRALKKSLKKWFINEKRRKKIHLAIKNFLQAIKKKDKELAQKKLSLVYKEIDKAAKTFLHKNKASRFKEKYAKIYNKTFKL
jgi:ribosomal protein S20